MEEPLPAVRVGGRVIHSWVYWMHSYESRKLKIEAGVKFSLMSGIVLWNLAMELLIRTHL